MTNVSDTHRRAHLRLLPGLDEDNAFTRLAHAMRHSRDHLPAEFLLPGDTVDLEGGLTVERVNRTHHLVTLDFDGIDYSLIVNPDRLLRVLDAPDGHTTLGAPLRLSDHFRSQARRHERTAEAHPNMRHWQAAVALRSLADFVEPDAQVARSHAALVLEPGMFGAMILTGRRTRQAVARYGYGYEVSPIHHVAFLDQLLVIVLEDAYEHAGSGADDRDPASTLYDFAQEAAHRRRLATPSPWLGAA